MRKSLCLIVALCSCSAFLAAPAAFAIETAMAKEIAVTSKSPAAVEAFKKGRELQENIRTAEAEEQFKKALGLDADFALAHAYLGSAMPGSAGLKHLETAASLSGSLPEAERTSIEIMLAERRGEEGKVRDLRKKLAAMAPTDWRAQLGLGEQLSADRKWNDAIAALQKAAELNPNAGPAYNMMGYAQLNMGKNGPAVEAFRKYVALMPNEPNPQDSLAEALMAAGRFDEAETTFRKAAEISPSFWNAWEGVAMTKFLRGDWPGGREAIAKAKAAASRPSDKLATEVFLAWSQAAEGNVPEALKTLDAAKKAAEAQKVDGIQAFAPLVRATLLDDSGKPEEALQLAAMTLNDAEKAGLPGGMLNEVRRTALAIRIDAESRLRRTADAKKTLALIENEGKSSPSNTELQSMIHLAQGQEAMARADAKAAAEHFAQCIDTDFYCRWQLVLAQEKAGDKAAAATERQRILTANRRDADYLYIRAKLSSKGGATASGK